MIGFARVILFAGFLTLSLVSCGERRADWLQNPPVALDDTSESYIKYFASEGLEVQLGNLQPVMDLGQRSLDWVAKVNSTRPPENKLKIWRKELVRGITMESPSVYNEALILKKNEDLIASLPEEVKRILLGTTELPATLPVPDNEFEEIASKIDKNLQSALRWSMMRSRLPSLRGRKRNDIRGYYFLKSDENLTTKLSNFGSQTAEEQKELQRNLQGLCENSNPSQTCANELNQAIQAKRDLNSFYEKYAPMAQRIWDGFFAIPSHGLRSDVKWTGSMVEVPFQEPADPRVKKFVQENIEDEWKLGDWALKLRFTRESGFPFLELVPNVTAHVDRVGGNHIVMDSNDSFEEYQAQFTIRHEFGHVLGFIDCYVEFYDDNLQAIVNYQVDLTNLMCSRVGKLKEIHAQELARAYR